MTAAGPLRIGFIPLVDAAALIVAADKGFAAAEGLEVELVREASWSNIRDKLAIGLFDAAHMLTPMAIASNLGLGHIKVPLAAPVSLATNGNAITVSAPLHAQLRQEAEGDIADPAVSARALAALARRREAQGLEPLTFGMTFPFSTHNYQLRYWMAEGGVDPDRDLRLVVLPPPYMVESLREGYVDGFCVGAPWNSIAVDAGLGVILHFGCEIFSCAPEKTLALRKVAAEDAFERTAALIRAVIRAMAFIGEADNRGEVAALLAAKDRVGVDAGLISRTLEGRLRIDATGATRSRSDYLRIGAAGARPAPVEAAWLYAQMVRWGQAPFAPQSLRAAVEVMRADLFDAAGGAIAPIAEAPGAIGAFSGPAFEPDAIERYLDAFAIGKKI
ncbi:CmpA/NrtA family ABC transporter substrate-binding protein [Methylocystis heyeri]|uniref:Nitrate transporter n=1 Tax=Methylocystis heyeri TaxID=391905 RepID=A0A6B8K9A7_9HYPH|nr:CmpA/NrtA family ABC transporter substrate-binding protein [Methylocystis heyeri]QGM44297.1 nitrate transporter [Methylocystis heyeri]